MDIVFIIVTIRQIHSTDYELLMRVLAFITFILLTDMPRHFLTRTKSLILELIFNISLSFCLILFPSFENTKDRRLTVQQ